MHCKGAWFEAGEVSSVQYDKPHDEQCRAFEASLGASIGLSALHCPDCDEQLTTHYLSDEYAATVDVCHQCSGAWISREQLEAVAHAPKLKEALQACQQETNWKTWLFQFASQLPVEFNLRAHRTPWVTYGLLALNALIFIVMAAVPTLGQALLMLGGLVPAEFAAGEHWYTALSYQFLHGGWLHLLGNLYFLYVVGDNLEDVLGHGLYLLLYLVFGVIAALFHVASNPSDSIFLVGASGAIAGLFGLYLLWFKQARLTFMLLVFQFRLPPIAYFAIWLAINILGLYAGGEGVAYWAHIGGFVAGITAGLLLKPYVLKRNMTLAMLHSPHFKR